MMVYLNSLLNFKQDHFGTVSKTQELEIRPEMYVKMAQTD